MCNGVSGVAGAGSAVLGNAATGGSLATAPLAGAGTGIASGTETANSLASPMISPMASGFLLPSGFGQGNSTAPAFDFASIFGGQSAVGGPSIFRGGGTSPLMFTA